MEAISFLEYFADRRILKTEYLTEPAHILDASVVAIGSFDGLHLGHRAILKAMVDKAHKMDVPSAVVTFEPHPRVVTKSQDVQLLTTIDEKIPAISALGADVLAILKFDENIANMSFEEFAKKYLIGSLGMKALVLGEDHGFGKNRAGDTDSLRKLGEQLDFELEIIEPVRWKHKSIRSNRIREYVSSGNMLEAAHMLGRPYSISGEIIEGRHRGRDLGFPTINLSTPPGKLLPPNGVYAAAENSGNPGLLYIGVSPTFEPKEFSVEFYGLSKPEPELGDTAYISVFERFRGEMAFESAEKLVEQMKNDLSRLRDWLDKNKFEKEDIKKTV